MKLLWSSSKSARFAHYITSCFIIGNISVATARTSNDPDPTPNIPTQSLSNPTTLPVVPFAAEGEVASASSAEWTPSTGGLAELLHNPKTDRGNRAHLMDMGGKKYANHILSAQNDAPIRSMTHRKATFLTCFLVASVYVYGKNKDATSSAVPLIASVVLYLLECSTCSTRKYLSNTMGPNEVRDRVEQMRSSKPRIAWHVECYHYRTYHRRNRDGGWTSHRERVVTHRASRLYQFSRWRDTTPTNLDTEVMESWAIPYIKISFSSLVRFVDEKTLRDYIAQKSFFESTEGKRDQYFCGHTTLEVDGFQSKMLAVTTGLGAPSTGAIQTKFYWLLSLIGLTVPFRIWFSRHCAERSFVIEKEVSLLG